MSFINAILSLFSRQPPPLLKPEPWRAKPLGMADLWSRSSVIHFTQSNSRIKSHGTPSAGNREGLFSSKFGQSGTGAFAGFREYEPGDDPRAIDWRATARSQKPIVRRWEPESQLPVVIMVDVSASLWVESPSRPIDFAFELALFIAASALARQMPVDLMMVSDRVELHFERLQGRDKLTRLISELTAFQPEHRNTSWNGLRASFQKVRPGSFLFWISDFLWLPDPLEFSSEFQSFQFRGIAVEDSTLSVDSESAVNYDCETGGLITEINALSSLKSRQRIKDWSQQSGMPILTLSTKSMRPELQLSHWLRQFSGNPEQ